MSQTQQHSGRVESQPETVDLYLEAAPKPCEAPFDRSPEAASEPAACTFSPQPAREAVSPEAIIDAVASGVAAHRRGAAVIVAESLSRYPDLALRIVMSCIKRAPSAASDILAGARQSEALGAGSVLR